MPTKTSLTMAVLGLVLLATPGVAQQNGGQSQGGGGLGGVLDTLGGILGGGSRKVQGTVVVTDGNSIVLRTNDRSTYRVDVASVDPSARAKLTPGQAVTVTARGGQGDVLTATEIQPGGDATSAATIQRVTGTVQETGKQRVLFKTGEGLVLPVDVSRVHGLPYLGANQPATLYYEQGPKQEIVAVWIQPGIAAEPSAAAGPSSASPPATGGQPSASPAPGVSAGRSLQGKVQTIGISTLTLETDEGKTVAVDTSGVDAQSVAAVRPGDTVTVTGSASADGGRFVAQSVRPDR
jgi:hypothetical protein